MASVGKASLTIVPKFDNLGKTVTSALNGVNGAKAGEKTGEQYASGFGKGTSGLVKSGAVMGVFSAATSRAMDMISSSVSGAVSRLDTLNNYPRVMQALGYSAEASESSIAKMSDHLTGLPTALNDMTSTVQGIAAVTGDLDQATAAGLALNDMLLASGSSTALTSAAMEQFRQMLAKGKPEMQDWKSLTSAMPGQMNQLAQSLLGPTANANDLYEALGGGGAEATISMDALMAKMVELDTTGTESFTSFADQAKNATGGIESSISNMETAIARGMAGVMDSIGSENISGAIKDVGGAFESALGLVGAAIETAKPYIGGFVGLLKDIGPSAVPAIAGLAGLAAAGKGLGGLASAVANASNAFGGIKGVAKGASESLLALSASMKSGSRASEALFRASGALGGAMGGPLVVGIGAAVAATGLIVGAFMDAKKKSDDFAKATTGLSDAASRAAGLDEYAGKVDGVGTSASLSALSVDDLTEAMGRHADKINEITGEAETQIAQLDTARGVIDAYAGQTDLSADAQGRLEWALMLVNEQFGLSITASDVAKNSYIDQDGAVQALTSNVDKLVESKKKEIELAALSSALTVAMEGESQAADTLAVARKNASDATESWIQNYMAQTGASRESAEALAGQQSSLAGVNGELATATAEYSTARDASARLREELGDSSVAASDSADAYDKWGNSLESLFTSVLKTHGTTFAGLKDDLRTLGASTEDLSNLSEEELLRLADAYDGTASSAAGALDELGVEMDEAKKKTAIAADGIKEAFEDMGLSFDGIDVRTFSQKLADAGVSTEQLNAVGSLNLAQLAESCGGNMDAMVFYIQHYNDTPILDKDGNVQVDKASLVDAQGNVYTWNGTDLYNKDGTAVVDDVSLNDAQGNVWTWNGTALVPKGTTATVDDGSVRGAIDTRENWNNGSLFDKYANASINIFRNITDFFTGGSGNAAGGIRLNAEGGYRFHAAGAIAHKAVPLDIVGEDGAEAIVPLTNKRYSLPFAKTLAEQMGSVGGAVAYNYYGDVYVEASTISELNDLTDFFEKAYRDGRAR